MSTQKQRREAERRRLQRQMERRRQQQQSRKRTTLIISIVGTIIVIATVVALIVSTNGNDPKPTPAAKGSNASSAPVPASSSAPTSAAPAYPCSWTKTAKGAKAATVPKSTTPPKTGKVTVSVATTQGTMTFDLDRSLAPCTVASFVSLAEQRYFDSTPCHRLTTSGIFVLQCGDPLGTGGGDPGYSIPDEATGNEQYPAGTIAMARTSAPHTGGSQFFIVYKSSPNLQQKLGTLQYTVFGKVGSGLDVVTKVAAAGASTGTDGKPKLPITLSKVKVQN